MSANYTWVPKKSSRSLEISNSKSSFQEAMGRAFGQAPWTLNEEHREKLMGMFAGTQERAFEFLANNITEFGEITVDYSY